MKSYVISSGCLGILVTAGLAVYGSVQGLDLANGLTGYLSLDQEWLNTTIKATGAVGGFGVGGFVGSILGSYLPGGERRKE